MPRPVWSLVEPLAFPLPSSLVSRLYLTASPLLRVFATPLDALSLPETTTCAPLSFSLPRRFFFVAPVAFASSTPSLTLCPGCEDEVVPRKKEEKREMLNSGVSIEGRNEGKKTLRATIAIKFNI